MSKTAEAIKIYQSGIVNLSIFVKKNEDNSITITQSNDFTHDEINVMDVNRKELALAIYPEYYIKTAELDSFIWKTAYEKYPDIEGASVSRLKRIENARDKFIVGAFWMREQSSSKDARIKELEAEIRFLNVRKETPESIQIDVLSKCAEIDKKKIEELEEQVKFYKQKTSTKDNEIQSLCTEWSNQKARLETAEKLLKQALVYLEEDKNSPFIFDEEILTFLTNKTE